MLTTTGRIAASLGAALVMTSACESQPPTHEASAPPDAAELVISDPDALDAVIDRFVDEGAFPFLYVRLEDQDGRAFYEHAATNPEWAAPGSVDGSTWFRIWSMSKLVTIAVALDLVEDGLLSLDDPVTDHIPEFADLVVAVGPEGENLAQATQQMWSGNGADPADYACPLATEPAATAMTVRDLINHTAGFYYPLTGLPCLDETFGRLNLTAARDSDELIARLATAPLIQQPGAGYHYGVSTTVLGLVAERASGTSLAALVSERITEPLGIEGLRYGLPDGATLFPRFTGADGALREARAEELNIFGSGPPRYAPELTLYLGGEGMVGTTDAYADFARLILMRGALNGVRVLEEATIDEMTAPHTQTDSEWGYNGYNLWVSNGKRPDGSQGVGGLWMGGGYEGTHFWIDPERGFVGLVMTQIRNPTEAGEGRDEIIREAVYEQLAATP